MHRSAVLISAAVIAVAAFTVPVHASSADGKRVIVTFRTELTAAQERAAIAQIGGVVIKRLPLVSGVAATIPNRMRRLAFGSPIERIAPDGRVRTAPLSRDVRTGGLGSWGNDAVGSALANRLSTGAGIKIGILDTGIDLGHPDLWQRIKGGYNVVRGSANWPRDFMGHGTHVAGIIASVAPDVEIYVYKVLDDYGNGWTSDMIEGIGYAIDDDVDIINMSLYGPDDAIFHEAIQKAAAAGIVVVAAAGNDGSCLDVVVNEGGDTFELVPIPDQECDSVAYPAAYEEVIAVSATRRSGGLAWFSSRGPSVDIAAPGMNIRSSIPRGERVKLALGLARMSSYAELSGTSMATPFVVGTIALAESVGGDLDVAGARKLLCDTATDRWLPGRDNRFGCGALNAFAVVLAATADTEGSG